MAKKLDLASVKTKEVTQEYEVSDLPEVHPEEINVKSVIEGPNSEPKEPEYDKEELLAIVDSLLYHGYAVEQFNLRRINVVLKSRFAWEDLEIVELVEQSTLMSDQGTQVLLGQAFVASALVEFGTDKFPPRNSGTKEELKKDFMDRVEFVKSLSANVVSIIETKLREFDAKQNYVTKHFDELLKDF